MTARSGRADPAGTGDDGSSVQGIRRLTVALGAVFVAVFVLALSMPFALVSRHLSPDAIEYMGIAYNWVMGRGWSCPVVYSYYLPGAVPPIHGMVMRPPVISLLVAPALALGATIWDLQLVQCVTASAIAGFAVLVARRVMSLPAAMAFGLALGGSDLWVFWSAQVLSEPIGAGMLLAMIAALPASRRSIRGAAVFGAAVGLAWLTRPNLALVLFAFVAAVVLEGPRRALRSRPLWTAVGVAAAVFALVNVVVRVQSGFAPFAHLGLLLQTTDASDSAFFQKSWTGGLSYLSANSDAVREALAASYQGLLGLWFTDPAYHFPGWLAIPAWIWVFARRERSFEARAVALAALGFLVLLLAFYGGYDPRRLSMPLLVCSFYLIALMLGDLADALVPRLRMASALPVVLVGIVFLAFPGRMASLPGARMAWEWVLEGHTIRYFKNFDAIHDPVCDAMDRDGLVAAYNPWNVYLWCGNAALWLPFDLDSQETLDTYLDALRPRYIVSNPGPGRSWPRVGDHAKRDALLRASDRLAPLVARGGLVAYRVIRPAPGPAAWSAPPPLVSIGRQ